MGSWGRLLEELICLEGILTLSCLRGSGLPRLIFLLEAPAEWLFQPSSLATRHLPGLGCAVERTLGPDGDLGT